jgi:hypothetical protein
LEKQAKHTAIAQAKTNLDTSVVAEILDADLDTV